MKTTKSVILTVVAIFMIFAVGCGSDGFKPTNLEMEIAGNTDYTATKICSDKKTTEKVWSLCTDILIDYDAEGEMGTEYIYVAFFDDDVKEYGVFTLYSNGSCCLAEDFDTFYKVKGGEKLYEKLFDYYKDLPEKE